MTTLEEELQALDAKLARAQKEADGLAGTLRRLRSSVRVGKIADIEKALPTVPDRVREAGAAADGLATAWTFDVAGHVSTGAYVQEVIAAAESAGLRIFARDGRIYCFPLLVRTEASQKAVRIGRKIERRIRASELVKLLAAAQKRPLRFKETQFLELLYKTYQRLSGWDARRSTATTGPVFVLADLHETLTLLPGSDYPLDEFGRDLLLLDRQPDLKARDGSRFELPKDTISKERVRRVTVYDEDGQERLYVGIRFVRGN